MLNPSFSSHLRRLTIALALMTVGACSTATKMVEKDGAGKRINTTVIPNATPKSEPITIAGNKSPYEVFGKTYWVLPTGKGYKETGIASWYGRKFHGRLTSNGEVYNMYGMTAAHKSLPIPSYARVTNTDNGRSIVVRINDRGPFHDERVIDLSFVGAMKLGFADQGTTTVLVETIDTEEHPLSTIKAPLIPKVSPKPLVPASQIASNGNYLQVGAFSDVTLARQLQGKIRPLTSQPIVVRNQDNLFKLWIGPISDNIELLSLKALLKKTANLTAFAVSP